MKRNIFLTIALFVCLMSFGQGEIDAYRYSNNDLSGTARGQAMGGAFGALGGDVTGIAINPAGIGVYRSSEIVGNISLTSPLIKGNTIQESNTKFSFDNISYISYYPLIQGSMLSLNFGFNYNRVKSFNQTFSASSNDMKSSLTDFMAQLTNGIYHSTWDHDNPYKLQNVPWLSVLGWDGYLINKSPGTSDGYESLLNIGEKVSPYLTVSEKGTVENYDFTIGSNISNVFYWGATFTFTELSYLMTSTYDESFLGVKGSGFKLDNYLETKGSGFQMKAGIIFKPVDALRLGLSYHSPVWYSMTDYYQGVLTPRGIYDDNDRLVGKTETPGDASSSYYLRTPGSFTLSAAAVLGTQAIVSLDYESKNYASMNLKDQNRFDFKDVNKIIKEDYKNTSTIRAGLEYRFTPQFSGRIGYAWAQNPYSSSLKSIGEIVVTAGTIPHYVLSNCASYITGGIGFRFTPQFYCDIALVHKSQRDDLYFFTPVDFTDVEPDSFKGTFTNQSLKGLITLGYKF